MKSLKFPCASCRNECLSETLGTYLLVLIGPASVVVTSLISSLSSLEALATIALVFGTTVWVVIVLFGAVSGAHINPAISVASVFSGSFRPRMLAAYVNFQALGGLLAGLSLRVFFSSVSSSSDLGSTKLAVGVSPLEGLVIETAGTLIFAFSALSASSVVRGRKRQAAVVGLTLFVLILLIGPFTGASFNPIRSLGPSLFSGYYHDQYIYWIGPFLGACGAGLIFRALKSKSNVKGRQFPVCVC